MILQGADVYVNTGDLCVPLCEYVKARVTFIEGETQYLYGFGDHVGHAEIYSKDIKSCKGQKFVLTDGNHNLNILSSLVEKSAIK